jgi:hypothetical protein
VTDKAQSLKENKEQTHKQTNKKEGSSFPLPIKYFTSGC